MKADEITKRHARLVASRSAVNKKDDDCDIDDTSMVKITADDHSCSDSLLLIPSPENDDCQKRRMGSVTRKELLLEMEELKFAETVKICSKNCDNLEEETSPNDSPVSSESGEAIMRKQAACRTMFEDIEEPDLEHTNLELVNLISPETPGSPTHVSNSMSLSDDGNKDEFLIDDEICDQPQLIFNEKHKSSVSMDIYSPFNRISKANSKESITSQSNIRSQRIQTPIRKNIERSGSYSTLSLQDSISSDDLMGDFEGSRETIDR